MSRLSRLVQIGALGSLTAACSAVSDFDRTNPCREDPTQCIGEGGVYDFSDGSFEDDGGVARDAVVAGNLDAARRDALATLTDSGKDTGGEDMLSPGGDVRLNDAVADSGIPDLGDKDASRPDGSNSRDSSSTTDGMADADIPSIDGMAASDARVQRDAHRNDSQPGDSQPGDSENPMRDGAQDGAPDSSPEDSQIMVMADVPFADAVADATPDAVPDATPDAAPDAIPDAVVLPPACEQGQTRVCYTGPEGTVNVGACRDGRDLCLEGNWSGICQDEVLPSEETCDGLDNNCNDQTDEIELCRMIGQPCTVGEGDCQREGQLFVNEHGALECSAQPGEPAATENCDGRDNDCNGEIDEGTDEPCETDCGNGQRLCLNGETQACNAPEPQAEICDGVNNDCDEQTDEGCGLGEACFAGVGECRREGRIVLNPEGGGVVCNAVADEPQLEVCDDRDNDCDEVVDNNVDTVGDECIVGRGECERRGLLICNGVEEDIHCSVVPGEATAEVCDGRDNDCDDFVDNGVTGNPAALEVPCESAACRVPGVSRCVDGDFEACLAVDPDRDADTFPDCIDTCPDMQSANQNDSDGDGAGDVCDNCPDTATDDRRDTDGDGRGNRCDNCPDTSNSDQQDADRNVVGDACQDDPMQRLMCAGGGTPDANVDTRTPGGTIVRMRLTGCGNIYYRDLSTPENALCYHNIPANVDVYGTSSWCARVEVTAGSTNATCEQLRDGTTGNRVNYQVPRPNNPCQ